MQKEIKYNIDNNNCWNCISHAPSSNGRPSVSRNKKVYLIYRYMYEKKYGEIPKGMVARHICDNPMCINPDHILLGTHNDNVQDCVSKRRHSFGEKNGHTKLREYQVIEIIKDIEHTRKELAEIYKCKYSNIVDIKLGRRWTYLKSNI